MMRVIDRVVLVIGLRHCGDIVRGVVEPCSIWRGRFSLTIPRIDSIRELVGFNVAKMSWQDMIQDSEFSPSRVFNLGVQERRTQSDHGGQTVTIGGVQSRYDDSSRRLVWDPRIAVLDSSTADTDEMVNFLFLKFTLGMLRFGCLEQWSSEELTKFVQLAWLSSGRHGILHGDSGVSTWQIMAMSRGCFTSYRLVWDPGDFTTYRPV